MAWTVPMTFVDGAVLTAAQLNTQLRDNFLETIPAKSTNNGGVGGGYFAVTGPYSLAERGVTYAEVNTAQSLTSTAYIDLATVGPSVGATTSSVALILFSVEVNSSVRKGECAIAVEVAGATSKEAGDDAAIILSTDTNSQNAFGGFVFFNDLTPGYNIFSLKYRTGDKTATFRNRRILALPM